METLNHLATSLREVGPWAATAAFAIAGKFAHSAKKAFDSMKETQFKADEAHEELCERNPEYARRYKTWLAHR
jgi:uncharacterized protein CbrC (UPF0167 family)